MFARWGWLLVVVTRPVPILAETVIILAGTTGLSGGRATIAVLLGSLPAAVVYALAGAHATDWQTGLIVFAGVLLVAGLAWPIGRRLLGNPDRKLKATDK